MRKTDAKLRLLSKMKLTDAGCWEFTGFRLPNGYGRIRGLGAVSVLAHRLSWEVHRGQIPRGKCVLHRCDNPPCVNPEHLFIGTHKDNIEDKIAKGRNHHCTEQPKTRGMRHWKARFTPEQVAQIRSRKDEPRKKLASEFGTSARYISSLICGVKRKFDGVAE